MPNEPCSGNSGGQNKSGGRQPAVPTKRARDGERFSPAEYIRAPRLAYASRSWLHGVGRLKMTTPALHKRTFTRAAGVSPPWFAMERACNVERTMFGRIAAGETRAASVSPPCQRNAHATGSVFHRLSTFAHHGWLTPAALGCTVSVG
jgi:hypothetical protein